MSDSAANSHNYFEAAYRNYDAQNPQAKLDHYVDTIEERLSSSEPRILDVGCGRGLFLSRVAARYPHWDLFAIDTDPSGLEATSVNVPGAIVRMGGADTIPFADATFDVITTWDVLEHVSDLEAGASEITRCLRPEGLLAVVVPVYDGFTGPLIRALDRDPTHLHKEPRSFWVEWMTSSFGEVMWHGIYRFLLTSSFYLHFPTHRMRNHAPAILMTGLKR